MEHRNISVQSPAFRIVFSIGIVALSTVTILSKMHSARAQAIPNQTNIDLIQSCVDNDGRPRIVATATACHRDQHPLNWNKIGSAGPQGPPGTPGVSGYERVVVTTSNEQLGAFGETIRTVSCTPGKKVVGGGGIIFNASGRWYVDTSGPISDSQWAIAFANATGNPISAGQMSVSAICIIANP
jgi:hypothetical protein